MAHGSGSWTVKMTVKTSLAGSFKGYEGEAVPGLSLSFSWFAVICGISWLIETSSPSLPSPYIGVPHPYVSVHAQIAPLY